jgi:hypothetical protein
MEDKDIEIKESELEEDIEEEEKEIEDEEFQEFFENPIRISTSQNTSHSLEKINISPEVSIKLEQGLENSKLIKEDEEDSIKYGIGLYKKDELNYQTQEEQILNPARTEIENLGKQDFFQRQEVGFINSNEISKKQKEYIIPSSQKIEDLGRNENPFERNEIKYKPINNQ